MGEFVRCWSLRGLGRILRLGGMAEAMPSGSDLFDTCPVLSLLNTATRRCCNSYGMAEAMAFQFSVYLISVPLCVCWLWQLDSCCNGSGAPRMWRFPRLQKPNQRGTRGKWRIQKSRRMEARLFGCRNPDVVGSG